MDYMRTLETLEGFSNALGRCSKHPVGAWAIIYPLVQVRGSLELLNVAKKAPCSLSVYYLACVFMDYTITLETEGFSNALGGRSEHPVHGSMPYTWII